MFMTWILIKIKWILNTAFRALRAHLTFIYSSFINFFIVDLDEFKFL